MIKIEKKLNKIIIYNNNLFNKMKVMFLVLKENHSFNLIIVKSKYINILKS
jgi:hypothetical protein